MFFLSVFGLLFSFASYGIEVSVWRCLIACLFVCMVGILLRCSFIIVSARYWFGDCLYIAGLEHTTSTTE